MKENKYYKPYRVSATDWLITLNDLKKRLDQFKEDLDGLIVLNNGQVRNYEFNKFITQFAIQESVLKRLKKAIIKKRTIFEGKWREDYEDQYLLVKKQTDDAMRVMMPIFDKLTEEFDSFKKEVNSRLLV
ncbi:hypothetical protein [Jiulongibacter sp. NS-SX5]|uniref:hypothetical protein n=1 Tax=Jiulongibacter sp. NS-SX5 TaxID=3463854 RepID=UPI00405937ED